MSLRIWLSVVVSIAVFTAGYAIGRSTSLSDAILRSEHGRPAVIVPTGPVAVTQGGKVFHDPTCMFMHGPVEMIPAGEAVEEGYTPCVRCMREALGK